MIAACRAAQPHTEDRRVAVHAAHIMATADTMMREDQTRRSLRNEIAALRRDLMDRGLSAADDLLRDCQRLLRRKLPSTVLQDLRDQLLAQGPRIFSSS